MKKRLLCLLILSLILSSLIAQNNVLVIDYNNSFSSDQQNNNSNIYNRLIATNTSVVRIAAIPAVINNATYDEVWLFGNMGAPVAANLNPIVTYMNGGGAVYVQSEVSCCNNQAAYADALINATVTVGGAITHNTTTGTYFQYEPNTTLTCTPWQSHGAAIRPFYGTPPANVLFQPNTVCGGNVVPADIVGVQFSACDMISGQGAFIANGDFNIFPLASGCAQTGILGTANNNVVIDLIADLMDSLLICAVFNTTGPTTNQPLNIVVCAGDNVPASAFVSAPAGGTFAWTNSDPSIGLAALGAGNTPAFIAVNNTALPIIANISVSANLNCQGPPTIYTITVNPAATVDAGTDTTICVGDPRILGGNPTATGGAGAPYVYAWTPAPNLNNSTLSNPTVTPTIVGPITYYAQVTDVGGCVAVDSVVITAISCCIVIITDTTMINASCFGNCDGSITITAPVATQYSIDNGATWVPSNIFSNLCAGIYTVFASNGNCSDSVTVTITEPAPISIPNIITDASCNGGSDGQITVNPLGGTPVYSYSWSVGGAGNSATATNLLAGQVTVTVTDANGCMQDSTFTVGQPEPTPLGSFDADILNGCSPLEVQFTNTMDPNTYASFSWEFGNGIASSNTPETTIYTTPGLYDVTLNIVDNNGCVGLLVKTAYIEVYDDPVANFASSPGKPTLFDPTIEFTDISQYNIVTWDWSFHGLAGSTIQHPSYTFVPDTGTYWVSLRVEDNHGCVDSTIKWVRVFGEHGVFIPNAFSPDDDGINEGFAPQGFGISENNYSFLIFDRWGELMFESHKLGQPWYGNFRGQLVPNGVFVWKLHFEDLDGNEHDEIGHVNILK